MHKVFVSFLYILYFYLLEFSHSTQKFEAFAQTKEYDDIVFANLKKSEEKLNLYEKEQERLQNTFLEKHSKNKR